MQTNSPPMLGRRYVLHEPLGFGSMGAVYRATDRFTKAAVAVKRVTSAPRRAHDADATLSDSTEHRVALAREFQTLASMRHPNVISVLDYGFDDERQPYITMELLDAPYTILQAGRGKPQAAQIDLLLQMLRALTYMHRRGVIHRDVKPTNVLVITPDTPTEGASGRLVKVLDFGLAIARGEAQNVEDGTAGTLAYMAPEVLIGGAASEASDLYAVGVIACELLAGHHPFDTGDMSKLVYRALYDSPQVMLDANRDLMFVIQRLLSKLPDERYPNADAAIDALCRAAGQPVPQETIAIRESFLQAAQFVGREAEIAQLSAALYEARHGRGSAWLIAGESGVGKSRLVNELRTQALVEGALVVRGHAAREGSTAYRLWSNSLKPLVTLAEINDVEAGALKVLLPDIEMLLNRPVPDAPPLDAAAAQMRLFATIRRLLKQQDSAVVFLLEDVHWAGDEDLALLTWLCAVAPELPVLVIGSFRDDENADLPARLPDMRCLKLERLPSDAIAALSGSMLGDVGRDPRVVELLQRETEGNVFFLVEVVRALAEEAGRLDNIGREALPERVFAGGVQQVVQRRLDLLPESVRPLLALAAVLGRELDLNLLRATVNPAWTSSHVAIRSDDDVGRWLAICANGAVLSVQEGVWRFAHDKLRDGVLDALPPGERARLHRQAAQAIERVYGDTPTYANVLAYHWAAAGDTDKESDYTAMAGAQALTVSAYNEAVRYLQRALDLTPPENAGWRLTMNLHLAQAYTGLSKFDEAQALYEQNLASYRAQGDTRGSARALLGLGEIEEAHGNYAGAEAYFRESLSLATARKDAMLEARALVHLANAAYRQGDFQRAQTVGQEALAANRAINHRVGIADTLKGLGSVAAGMGDFTGARQYFEESLALYREVGQKRGISGCVNNLGIINVYLGELETAKGMYLDSLAIKTEIGDVRGRASTLNNLSIVHLRLDEFADARQTLEECLALYHTIGDRQGVADALINLGRVWATLGERERAETMFRDSQQTFEDIGDQWGVALALLNRGRVARDSGDTATAGAHLRNALRCAYDLQKPSTIAAVLVEFALLRAREGRDLEALHLLGVTLEHPAIEAEYQGYASTLYTALSSIHPAEHVAAALGRFVSVDDAVLYALHEE